MGGKYLTVERLPNKYYDIIVNYVLEHFDTPEYADAVIVVGAYIYNNVAFYRDRYPGKRIIMYNLEQMVGSNNYLDVDRLVSNLRGADMIWDYDYLNTEFLRWYGIIVDEVKPFLYTSSLKMVSNREEPSIDILFYGYMNEVRMDKFKRIYPALYHDYSVMMLSGFDYDDQLKYIADAKVVLNVHGMSPYSRQEQERIGFALINEKCVLSEESERNYFGSAIIESKLDAMSGIAKWLVDSGEWKSKARMGHEMFKKGIVHV